MSSSNQTLFDSLQSRSLLARRAPPSLALHLQLLGAQFCATLSQAALTLISGADQENETTSSAVLLDRMASRATAALLAPVTEDLSAHFGSHARRRGGMKPLGPAFRTHDAPGAHLGRAARIWRLSTMHRHWCPRCSVWLQPNVTTNTLGVPESSGNVLSPSTAKGAVTCGQSEEDACVPTARIQKRVCARCLRRTASRIVRRLRHQDSAERNEYTSLALNQRTSSSAEVAMGMRDILRHCQVKRPRRRLRKRANSSPTRLHASTSTVTLIQAIPKGPLMRTARNAAKTTPRQPPTPSQTTDDAAPTLPQADEPEFKRVRGSTPSPLGGTLSAKVSTRRVSASTPIVTLPPRPRSERAKKAPAPGTKKVMDMMNKLGF